MPQYAGSILPPRKVAMKFTVIFYGWIFVWTILGFAQSVQIPATANLLEEYNDAYGKHFLGNRSIRGKTFIVAEAPTLYQTPKLDSARVPSALHFRDIVFAYAQAGEFFLISKEKIDHGMPKTWLGWIHEKDLQLSAGGLKVVKTENGFVLRDIRYGLYAKALIINSLQSISADRQQQEIEALKTRQSPNLQASTLEEVVLYNWFFIWKEIRLNDATWMLLARVAELGTYSEAEIKENIIGWVPSERLYQWCNAYALEENFENRSERLEAQFAGKRYQESPDAPPGALISIFFTKEHLKSLVKFLQSARTPVDQQKYLKETKDFRILENLSSQKLACYEQRYPLIETGVYDSYEWYKLGIIGDLLSNKGKVPAKDIDLIKQMAAESRKKCQTLELIFVIDDTGSMVPHFSKVKRAVDNIQKKLLGIPKEELHGLEFRYKLVKYRDFLEKRFGYKSFVVRETSRHCTPNPDDVKRELNEHAHQTSGGDALECPFYAIQTAIGNGDVFEEGSWRIMILLGDTGNHLPDGLTYEKAPSDSDPNDIPMSVQDVANILQKNKVYFHAIQVIEPTDPPTQAFAKQMKQILELCGAGNPGTSSYLYSYTCEVDKADEIIVQKIRQGIEANLIYQRMLEDVLAGRMVKEKLPSEVQAALKTRGNQPIASLMAFNFQISLLQRLVKELQIEGQDPQEWFIDGARVQVFHEGYAFAYYPFPDQRQRYPLFKKVVIASFKDIKKMSAFLNTFLENAEKSESKLADIYVSAIQQYYKENLRQLIGANIQMGNEEVLSKFTVAEIQEKLTGFPPQSSLLKIPMNKLEDPAIKAKLFPYLQAINTILEARLQSKAYQVIEWIEADGEKFPAKVKILHDTMDRIWFERDASNDSTYAWVPCTELP